MVMLKRDFLFVQCSMNPNAWIRTHKLQLYAPQQVQIESQ